MPEPHGFTERNQASSILHRGCLYATKHGCWTTVIKHTHARTRLTVYIHTHVNRELILQTYGTYAQLAYISQMKYALALYIITTRMHCMQGITIAKLGNIILHRWCIGGSCGHFAVSTAVLHYDLFGMVASINGCLTSKLWIVTIQYDNAIKSTVMCL